MKFLENLKLDKWWAFVLYLGVGALISALMFKVDFVEEKYLFGLGIGMILIGLSFWIAEKHLSGIKPPNAYTGGAAMISWHETRHNWLTIILLIAGLAVVGLFGFLIIKNLI